MPSFPTLTSGQVTMAGLVSETHTKTRILEFADGSEQAWAERPGFVGFTLSLTSINGYDLSNVLEFWRSQGLLGTWDITINGMTHNNVSFASDEFPWTDPKATRFSLSLPCIQVTP